jgi:DNA-binding response OmpR family regulator
MSKEALGRLLLVEDEPVLRGLVHQFLSMENYDVEPAADGQDAIDAYAARGPYDLILMDLNMPRVPGVEACRQIKRMNHGQPILVCSAAILESHVEALRALGVHDSLMKPYHPVELTSAVRRMLADGLGTAPRGRSAWRDHRAHVDAGPNSAARSHPSALPDLGGLE